MNYPKSTIFSFEPVSETYQILLKNTRSFDNIICLNKGVTNKDGFDKIFVDENRLGRSSTIKKHREMEISYSETIKTIDLNNFIKIKNITKVDILKIDVEGCEDKILKSIENSLSKIAIV